MKGRYVCIVLIVSAALLLHADSNRSHSGNAVSMRLNAQGK
ncbi:MULTISPECIES: small toxic inner membrane protein TimP [Enterobacteriaceae]|nr:MULTISPECIES: small toxic inner membrane protein TimP [Enterobacteriaceae]